MKQLLLAAMVSVVCSVIAVGWLGNKGATGGHSGEHAQRTTEPSSAGTQSQGNRNGAQAGGQRQGGHGGQQAGGQSSGAQQSGDHTHGGHAQGERAGGNSGQGGRNNRIAGFSAGDIENSLADMTAKLALSPDQQANIRQALETYQQSVKIAREQFMQTRAQLTALDVTVATYEEDKARVLQNAQAAYQELLLLTVSTREAIYQSLNSTQQQILTNLEA